MRLASLGVVLSLINAMIGSIILVLPLLFLQSGVASASIVVVVIGGLSCYSCSLFLQHLLPNEADIPQSLGRHFRRRLTFMPRLYSLASFLNLTLTCLVYYFLINLQWASLLGLHGEQAYQYVLYSVNSLILLAGVVFSDYFGVALRVACYGAISVLTYFGLVVWLFATNPERRELPPLFSTNVVSISGCMSLVFSIQMVFVPMVTRVDLTRREQSKCLYLSFLLGGVIYIALGVCGAYGIIGRTKNYTTQDSLLDFFNRRDSFPYAVEIAFLLHLYSIYPCYVSVARTRLREVLSIEAPDGPACGVAFAVVLLAVSTCLQFTDFKLSELMSLNGSICAFFYTYLIPAVIHVKCQYFPDPPE
jgi:sodium-coupled neutral amino acid transporter 9